MGRSIKGFTVTLEYEISEEGSEMVKEAIKMIKSVSDVVECESNHSEDYMNRSIIRNKLKEKFFDLYKSI
jgi:hypothetical protein